MSQGIQDDWTNKSVGFWTVLSIANKDEHNLSVKVGKVWKCICKCGYIKYMTSNDLRSSPKECRKCNTKTRTLPCVAGDISSHYWNIIKNSSKKRKLLFSITPEYIWSIFIEQNKKCALSGIDLTFERNLGSRSSLKTQTASLDRIDSSKGYIEGNVQWVHKTINRLKMDLSDNEFIQYCKNIAKYQTIKDNKTKNATIICDIDGCLLKHKNTTLCDIIMDYNENPTEKLALDSVGNKISEWHKNGNKIVLITARPESMRELTIRQLNYNGIAYHHLIMGMNNGPRYLINDSSKDGDCKCYAFDLPRNEGLTNVNI